MQYDAPFWDEQYMLNQQLLQPDIIALGDSWLHYPFNNLATEIHAQTGQQYVILVGGEVGQEAQDWIKKKRYARQAKWYIQQYGQNAKAFILSAGGNDFADPDDFDPLLLDNCTGIGNAIDCFEPGQPDALFQAVLAGYDTVVTQIRSQNPTAPIFLHNYDYAYPSGKGLVGHGNWLREPMDTAQVARGLQADVVRYLIDSFTTVVQSLEASDPNVHLVQTAGTLTAQEWANELHPTPAAFARLGEVWVTEMAPHLG